MRYGGAGAFGIGLFFIGLSALTLVSACVSKLCIAMAIKVKAVERNVSFDKNSEKWAYVLQAEMAYGLKAYSLEGMDTLHYSRPFTGGALNLHR